jgi:uncharacterized membrane protein YbhN (UPF0104 family)
MVLLCGLSPLFLPGVAREPALLVLVALSIAGCVGLGGCLASTRLLALGTFLLRTCRLGGLAAKLESFVSAVRTLARDPKSLLGIAGLTLVFHLFSVINVQMAFVTLGESVHLPGLIGSVFLVMLISAIPVSINGLGLSEGAYVYCLGLAGVAPATAASVALILRAKSILTGAIGGLVSLSGVVPEARISGIEPEVSRCGEDPTAAS